MASLVFSLAAVEAGARWLLDPATRSNRTEIWGEIMGKAGFPGASFRPRPGAVGVQGFGSDPRGYFDAGATLTYRINSLGFRGPEVKRVKAPGAHRILGLGDSFAFGTGVRQHHTYLARLQEHMDEESSARPVEVLNLGVPAYDTVNEVALLRYVGLALDPDLVVICFYINDVGEVGKVKNSNPEERAPGVPFWRRGSRLLDYVAASVERRDRLNWMFERYHQVYREDGPAWKKARAALVAARNMSREDGFDLVVMIFPMLWRLSDGYPLVEQHQVIADFLDRIGVPVFDLLPAFEGYAGPELWVHPNDQHPNEIAHGIAADALFGFLQDSDLIPR